MSVLFPVIASVAAFGASVSSEPPSDSAFFPPTALVTAQGTLVDVGDGYGYAGPTLGDLDADGIPDLLVGQFDGGRFRLYRGLSAVPPRFAEGEFLRAEGQLASVPMG